jgi:outer membrane protein
VEQGPCGERGALNLKDSLSEALSANPSLKAYKERMSQARYVLKQAGTAFLPRLTTSYGYTRFDDPLIQRITVQGIPGVSSLEMQAGTQENYQWKGGVSQPIFTGFALLSSYELAKLGIDLAELEYRLAMLDLVLNVKEAYFGILRADKGLEVASKAVESLKAHVTTAENFHRVGLIPVNELLKAEVALGNATHDLVKAGNAARLARSLMNTLLARPVERPIEVEDVLDYRSVSADFESCLAEALRKRPEIAVLEVNLRQTEQKSRLAASRFYPEVAFNWEYIKEGDEPGVGGSPYHEPDRWEIMVGAKWTLWEWGKTYYEVKEAESLRIQVQENLKSLKDSIGLQVKQALLALEEAEKNIPISRKAVEQAEENLRVSRERYNAQVATSTDVLDAQTLLTQARTNYYSALYEHNLAKARLERAMGGGE